MLKSKISYFSSLFINWFNNLKKIQYIFSVILLCVYMMPIFSVYILKIEPNIYMMVFFYFLILIIPFCMLITTFTKSNFFNRIYQETWLKLTFSVSLLLMTLCLNIWAVDIINEIFKLPASYFPLTQIFTTVFGFIILIMKPVFTILFYFLLTGSSIFFIILIFTFKSIKSLLLNIIHIIVFMVVVSATHTTISNVDEGKNEIIQSVAEEVDFYKYNRCSEDFTFANGGMIFLSENQVFLQSYRVLNNKVKREYKVSSCTLK